MKKIAFVVPWHGENIPGGAEAALRDITNHLFAASWDIEILTTTVKQFTADWNVDFYPEGLTEVYGIPVRRFKIRKRDVDKFNRSNLKLMKNIPLSDYDEKVFCEENINSPELYAYMENHKDEYSFFVFIPYMFGTTYYGCQIAPEKSILIPCFHDESYIYMNVFKKTFSKVRGMMFNAEPERILTEKVYDVSKVKTKVMGLGMDTNISGNDQDFREKFNINSPFMLYAGRKDEGKNVHTLIKYFDEYKKRNQNDLKLVLIGGGNLPVPDSIKNDVYDLGFVDIQDKYNAYAAAEFLCQPSHNESFSYVIMESWLCNRPVIVSEDCNVTSYFAKDSKGGLYFKDYFDFEGAINFLLNNRDLSNQMGKNGCEYVKSNFDWNVMIEKYREFFKNISMT